MYGLIDNNGNYTFPDTITTLMHAEIIAKEWTKNNIDKSQYEVFIYENWFKPVKRCIVGIIANIKMPRFSGTDNISPANLRGLLPRIVISKMKKSGQYNEQF